MEYFRLSEGTYLFGGGQGHDKVVFKTCDTDCPGQDMNIKKLSANHNANCIKLTRVALKLC